MASSLFGTCGMSYGWSAPVLVRLLSNNSEIPMSEEEAVYVVAAVELGYTVSAIPAGFISDRIGRKPVILSVILILMFGWALIITTRSLILLILARITLGIGSGIVFSTCPLYLGEIAEPEIRGKVTAVCMVFYYAGILTSYCIGPYVSYSTFAYTLVSIAAILGITLIFIPESPYNLLSRNKLKQAKTALKKLRNKDVEPIEQEAKSIKLAIDEIKERNTSVTSLFVDPCSRMSTLITLLLGLVLYLGGLTVVYTYATHVFTSIDGFPLTPDQCTILLGVIFTALSLVTTSIVDNFGRRRLFLISVGGSAICHFIGGLYFYLKYCTSVNVSGLSWMLLLDIAGYCFFKSIGISPLVPVYQSEIFPEGVKGVASGLSVVEQGLLSMSVLKLFQVVNLNFGKHVSFFFFSFINGAGFVLMYIYLIETKGKTLAEIQCEIKARMMPPERKTSLNETTIPLK